MLKQKCFYRKDTETRKMSKSKEKEKKRTKVCNLTKPSKS